MLVCRPCAQWFGAIPRACRCSAQLGGISIRRETPRPRGRVPSTAAWTMAHDERLAEIEIARAGQGQIIVAVDVIWEFADGVAELGTPKNRPCAAADEGRISSSVEADERERRQDVVPSDGQRSGPPS